MRKLFPKVAYALLACLFFTLPAFAAEDDNLALFRKPVTPIVGELPPEALATWRVAASDKPALVLFSGHPLLLPIPAGLEARARKLAAEGNAAELRLNGSAFNPSPTLLPEQTVSAALALNLFSSIYWVSPSRMEVEQVDPVQLRDEMANRRFLTPEESGVFRMKDGIVSGKVRGIPLHIVHPDHLPVLRQPVILHVDLSYLAASYRNEEGTPAYSLLADFAKTLRALDWPVKVLTLSYSNAEGQVPLDLRFLLSDLVRLAREPQLLDQPLPETWQLRAEGLAQTTLLQHDKAFAAYRRAQELSPDNADIQFDLYLVFKALKQPKQAMAALDRAVRLDRGFAFEYLNLARKFIVEGGYVEGSMLLEKAIANTTNNQLFKLQLADTQIRAGHAEMAKPILNELKQEPWSETYHRGIPGAITKLEEHSEQQPPSNQEGSRPSGHATPW